MASQSHSAIYPPPREGLPFLVVTFTDGEMTAFMPVESRDTARAMLAAQSGKKNPPPLRAVS
jgi:hypothetical protein